MAVCFYVLFVDFGTRLVGFFCLYIFLSLWYLVGLYIYTFGRGGSFGLAATGHDAGPCLAGVWVVFCVHVRYMCSGPLETNI